jgi:hypothetical protein
MISRLGLALVSAFLILSGCSDEGATSDTTSSATPTTASSQTPSAWTEVTTLSSGRYALMLDGLEITFEAEGWEAWENGVNRGEGGPPAGSAIGFWVVDDVYADPCDWDRGFVEPPIGPGVDDLAAALVQRPHIEASEPKAVELKGFEGKQMRLQVSRSIDFIDCAGTQFRSWAAVPDGSRYHQGPGQIDLLWILDVDGTRLVIDMAYFPATSRKDRAELMEILESVQIV